MSGPRIRAMSSSMAEVGGWNRATPAQHRIVDVGFQRTADAGRPMSEAPILCICGVPTTSGAWDEHRGTRATQLGVRAGTGRKPGRPA